MVEASSGSTAISEAYFARLVGLPFVAVVARSTSPGKIALIEREGGRCEYVDSAGEVYDAARRFADELGGHYLDQFTNAERATDWRGNNNIAESIFEQLAAEPHPVPAWIVVGAGTGGTSATIGRYLRYRGHATRLAVVDPEGSAFLPGLRGRGRSRAGLPHRGHRTPTRRAVVPAAGRRPHDRRAGRRVGRRHAVPRRPDRRPRPGPSTGTNIYGALRLACELHEHGLSGSIVTLMCDRSDRYDTTFGNDRWLQEQGIDPAPYREVLEKAWSALTWMG